MADDIIIDDPSIHSLTSTASITPTSILFTSPTTAATATAAAAAFAAAGVVESSSSAPSSISSVGGVTTPIGVSSLGSATSNAAIVTPTIQNIVYSILYSTVSLAAIGGNGVVIYLIINFRRMRSVTDMFILNLALGDLLMAILCIPFTFTSNLLFHGWPFGSIMCRVVSYAQAVCVFISAYTLVAISIDRYIAIIYPLRPRMTKRHCQYLVAFIWLVALLTPLPTALLSRLVLQPNISGNPDLEPNRHQATTRPMTNNETNSTTITTSSSLPDKRSLKRMLPLSQSSTVKFPKISSVSLTKPHKMTTINPIWFDNSSATTINSSDWENLFLQSALENQFKNDNVMVDEDPEFANESDEVDYFVDDDDDDVDDYGNDDNNNGDGKNRYEESTTTTTTTTNTVVMDDDGRSKFHKLAARTITDKNNQDEIDDKVLMIESPETPSILSSSSFSVASDHLLTCTEDWNENQEYKSYYSVILMVLQYILPFTVLVFTYSRIGWIVWGRQTPGEAYGGRDARIAASKRKMVKMMITCVVAFTLCWLPLNIFIVIGDHYPEIYNYHNIEYVWVACHWLAMSHASYNPFIYMWMNRRFRNGFRYVIRRFCCCWCYKNRHHPNGHGPDDRHCRGHLSPHELHQTVDTDYPLPPQADGDMVTVDLGGSRQSSTFGNKSFLKIHRSSGSLAASNSNNNNNNICSSETFSMSNLSESIHKTNHSNNVKHSIMTTMMANYQHYNHNVINHENMLKKTSSTLSSIVNKNICKDKQCPKKTKPSDTNGDHRSSIIINRKMYKTNLPVTTQPKIRMTNQNGQSPLATSNANEQTIDTQPIQQEQKQIDHATQTFTNSDKHFEDKITICSN